MSTAKENRLHNVRQLVERNGGVTSFATRLGVRKQYVSQIAGQGNEEARKPIGDDMARKIEREFSLPKGFLDQDPEQSKESVEKYQVRVPMLQVAGSNKNQELARFKEDAVSEIVFIRPWMRQHVNASDHDHMNVATVRTDKMSPTFNRGDWVIIDAAVHDIVDAGIFVFERDGVLYINRLQPTKEGIKLLCDNQHYETEVLDKAELAKIVVYGRVSLYANLKFC